MFEKRSSSFSLSAYDWWAPLRGVLLFLLAGLVMNIETVNSILASWNVPETFGTLIVWYLLDLARRYMREYRPEEQSVL